MNTSHPHILKRLSVMMFLQFFIWGAWFISIPNFMGTIDTLGFDPYWAYKAGPIAAMIAPFFLGLVADRFFNTEKVMAVLFLLAGATMFLLPFVAYKEGAVEMVSTGVDENGVAVMKEAARIDLFGFSMLRHEAFSLVTFLHQCFFMPTLALSASLAFTHLPKGNQQFPLVRLWGTMGWIVAGFALAWIFNGTEVVDGKEVAVDGAKSAGQFYLAGGASILLAIFAITLPRTPAPKKGEKVSFRDLLFVDVIREFKVPSFAVFVIVSFLVCIPLQAYYTYLQTQMGVQKIEPITIWKNVGTWIEAAMMFAMPFFFRKLGVKKMISLGIGAWVLRYALFPLATSSGVVSAETGLFMHAGFWFIIAGVALHGLCYDFFFVTGQIYVDQVASPKIRAQAQAMIVFFTQGLGMFVGAVVNEKLFMKAFKVQSMPEAYGKATDVANLDQWGDFWWPLCGAAAFVLVLFIVAFKHKDKKEDLENFSH